MNPVLQLRDLTKSYPDASGRSRTVLDRVSLELAAARSVAITGPSGTGKSTLLNLISGIDVPTSGTVAIHGRALDELGDGERARLRRDKIGFVFQFFHLLPHLSVEENVGLPAMIAGKRLSAVRGRVTELLRRVRMEERARDLVGTLSGGEMQRVAICRALLRHPPLILADEPTGNLDRESGSGVMHELLRLVREEGATLLYVTHSDELAALGMERWRLEGGRLIAS